MGQEHLPSQPQGRYRLFTADAGEVLKELIQGIARFEVVEEGTNRDPGPHENRRTAQDVRVTSYDGRFRHGAVPFKRCQLIFLRLLPSPSEISRLEQA